jgi:hypothetical protein
VAYLPNAKVFKCYQKHEKQKFSLKVGTIFEDSPLGLDKWLPATWLIVNAKNGINSCELSRDLGVTQKTAWFMLHRIRVALRIRGAGVAENPVVLGDLKHCLGVGDHGLRPRRRQASCGHNEKTKDARKNNPDFPH